MIDDAGKVIVARDGGVGGRWSSVGKSDFARERLGEMAGLRQDQAAALAQPEGCGENLCTWRSPRGRQVASLQHDTALTSFCTPGAIVVAKTTPTADWRTRCNPAALIDGPSFAHAGGASIYETGSAIAIARVYPPGRARAWDGGGAIDTDE